MRSLRWLAYSLFLGALGLAGSAHATGPQQRLPDLSPACPPALVPQRLYVDASAIGAGTGQRWADAFVDLQSALGSIQRGEIWVAAMGIASTS